MQHATRAEAERLLGIADKLLQNRDLMGSREFAILAQETEPLLEGSDQILAIVDVLLASEKRVNNTNHPDWYAILGIDRRSDDLDLIKKQYRRLALLLHPDKSRFAFADHAFKLVADAWALLSDPLKKGHYDKDLSMFSRVDLSVPGWVNQQEKLPVRRTGPGSGSGGPSAASHRNSAAARDEISADENTRRRNNNNNSNSTNNATTFWTACPYCYRLYEYPKVYEGCCLRCGNCERSFHGVAVPSLPPLVPGEEAYYCCWGFFPMGFVIGSFNATEKEAAAGPVPVPVPEPASAPAPVPVVSIPPAQPPSSLPNWMPAPAPNPTPPVVNGGNTVTPTRVTRAAAAAASTPTGVPNGVPGTGPKKRGRPRKYV